MAPPDAAVLITVGEILFAATGCGLVGKENVMQTGDLLLDTVKSLSARQPLAMSVVSEATGLKLNPVPTESTAYFAVYRSSSDEQRPWADAEFRKPKDLARFGENLLVLRVGDGTSVEESSVRTTFGPEDSVEMPRPDAPPGTPTYLIYNLSKRKLSFGFVGGSKPVLKTVVIEDICNG